MSDENNRNASSGEQTATEDPLAVAAFADWHKRNLQSAIEWLYPRLEQLVVWLQRSAPEVAASYAVPGERSLSALRQGNYVLRVDDVQQPRFTLGFECSGGAPLSIRVNSRAERDDLTHRIGRHGLQFAVIDHSTWYYEIQVKPVVHVRLGFEADNERSLLRITAHNLFALDDVVYSVHPSRINQEFIDQLRLMLLRQDNRFAEVTSNRVDDSVRERFQSEILHRKRERALEVGDADPSGGARLRLGGIRRLFGGGQPETAAVAAAEPPPGASATATPPPAAPSAPRTEPVMVRDGEDEPKLIWDEDRKRFGRPGGADASDEDFALQSASAYAWVVTGLADAADTDAMVGKMGPRGANKRFTIGRILAEGEHFQLLDARERPVYNGAIAGRYEGLEPLTDFGITEGCEWVRYVGDGRRYRRP